MKIALFLLLYFVFVCVDIYAVTKGIVSKEYSNIALKQLALAGLIKNSSIPVTTSQPTVATGSSESYDNYSATVTSSWNINSCAYYNGASSNVISGSIRCAVNSANKKQATVTWSQKYGTTASSFSVKLNYTEVYDRYSATTTTSSTQYANSCSYYSGASSDVIGTPSCIVNSGNRNATLTWSQKYGTATPSSLRIQYNELYNRWKCEYNLSSDYSPIGCVDYSFDTKNYLGGCHISGQLYYAYYDSSYTSSKPTSCKFNINYYDRKRYYANCSRTNYSGKISSASWSCYEGSCSWDGYTWTNSQKGIDVYWYQPYNQATGRVTITMIMPDSGYTNIRCNYYWGNYLSRTSANTVVNGVVISSPTVQNSYSYSYVGTATRTSSGNPANETKTVTGTKVGSQVANNTLKMPTSEVLGKVNIAVAQSCHETDLLPIGTSQVPKKCNNAMKLTYGRAVNDGTVLVDAAKNAIVDPNMQAASFPNVSEKSGAFSSKEAKRIDMKLGGTGAPYKNDRVIAENDIRDACIVTGGDNEQEYSDSSKKDMCILSFAIEG